MAVASRPPLPDNLWDLSFVDRGVSGIVFAIDDASVIKTPTGGEANAQELNIERRIFERLGEHPRITKLLYIYNGMIVLERLQYPIRARTSELLNEGLVPSEREILKWSAQAAEGMQYLHEKNVFQVDIGLHNMLLDWDDNLKYCDFSGSSIDGETPLVVVSPRAQHPRYPIESPTVHSELFSLGSAIYEISTAQKVYNNIDEAEIQDRYTRGEYPRTDHLLLGQIIRKCWVGQYRSAYEAATEIRAIQRAILGTHESSLREMIERKQKRTMTAAVIISFLRPYIVAVATSVAYWSRFPIVVIKKWT